MTKDDAMSYAQAYVKNKYPIVPPITSVQHRTVRQLGYRRRLITESWMQFGGSTELRRSVSLSDLEDASDAEALVLSRKWLVFFFMSWDTDAVGMPETLYVTVDDLDGSVTQLSPEKSLGSTEA